MHGQGKVERNSTRERNGWGKWSSEDKKKPAEKSIGKNRMIHFELKYGREREKVKLQFYVER